MFRSSVLVTFLTLSASGLGLLVQLYIAKRFGIGMEVDAYLFAMSIPTFIAGMLGAMLSYVVIPKLVACETDSDYQNRYISSLLLSVSGIALALVVIGSLIVSPIQLDQLPIHSRLRSLSEMNLLQILSWTIGGVQILSGVVTSVLNAGRHYIQAAALSLLPYVGMLAALSIELEGGSIVRLPIGMLAGTFVAVASGLYLLRSHIITNPRKYYLAAEMRLLAWSSPYAAIAMSCFSSYAVIDAFWATRSGTGTLATLGYAQRLVIALGNLVVAGPSAVLIPTFAEFIREKDFSGFLKFLVKSLLIVGSGVVVLAVFLTYFVEDIIRILFAHGAFGEPEVRAVAQTLTHMLPGMITMLLSVIAMRALFCLENTHKIGAALGIMWGGLYFLLSSWFYKNGAASIATGYSITWGIMFIGISFSIWRVVRK